MPNQNNKIHYRFKSSVGNFDVWKFKGCECINKPYRFQIFLKAYDSHIDPADLVKKRAVFSLLINSSQFRYINGIIGKVSLLNPFIEKINKSFSIYYVELYPLLWLLKWKKQTRIFQEISVPDIISFILDNAGLEENFYYSMKGLTKNYPKREYCVQYNETDYRFIIRLMSETGIFFFFKQGNNKEEIIFGDDPSSYTNCIPEFNATYRPDTGKMTDFEPFIYDCGIEASVYSGKVVLNDFNFENPDLNLQCMSASKKFQELEVYDQPGNYQDSNYGQLLALNRKDSISLKSKTIKGEGTFRCFSPGHKFKVLKHPGKYFKRLFVVLKVKHTGIQSHVFPYPGEEGLNYGCKFKAINASSSITPERIIPKPHTPMQTAIVVGPPGQEIHTDKYGRVKVKFHWDREDKNSCWIRVSQISAGANWGSLDIPRIGHEVIVDFLNANPDEPIIIGRVYNKNNAPPYTVKDSAAITTIKTQSIGGSGDNELRLDASQNAEEIYLHGQKDWNIKIDNNKNQRIVNNETMQVGNSRSKNVGASQSESIGASKTINVGSNHTESIGGNMSLSIAKNKNESVAATSAENVGASKALSVGGAYQISVGAAMNTTVALAQMEEVGLTKNITVGDKIEITCGAGKIVIEKSGKVTIEGTEFDFSSSGPVKINGSVVDIN